MKALSVRQPWAELILSGAKNLELRTWSTRYRGTILIHASKTIENEVILKAGLDPSILARGALVGVAEVRGCRIFIREDAENLRMKGAFFGEWIPELYAWELGAVRRITPIPCVGALGLFEVPAEIMGLCGRL